ncbi:hypothetical protein P8610_03955 [Fictibacillus sp. UD]
MQPVRAIHPSTTITYAKGLDVSQVSLCLLHNHWEFRKCYEKNGKKAVGYAEQKKTPND